MAQVNGKYGLNVNMPDMSTDMERIAADRLMMNQLLQQQQAAQSQGQLPYKVNLPQLNVNPYDIPAAPKFVPFSQSEEGKKVIEELTQKKADAELRQQKEMDAAREQLQEYLNKEKSLDLLPMAALADAWTGSNMARYFKDEKDINRQLALELQKELMKYGQAGVDTEADALTTKLKLGADEAQAESLLARQAYEAELRAKQAMFDTNIDAATRLKLAQDAKAANEELEKLRQKNRLELERLRQKGRVSDEGRQARAESRQIAKDLNSDQHYKAIPMRIKLLAIVDKYEKAVQELDSKKLAVAWGPTRTKLEGIYNEYSPAQKDANQLGALTGSDLGLIWGQMPDATSLMYALQHASGGTGKQAILDRIKAVKDALMKDQELGKQFLYNSYRNIPEAVDSIEKQDQLFKSKMNMYTEGQNKQQSPQTQGQGQQQNPKTKPMYQGGYEYRLDPVTGKYKPTGRKK